MKKTMKFGLLLMSMLLLSVGFVSATLTITDSNFKSTGSIDLFTQSQDKGLRVDFVDNNTKIESIGSENLVIDDYLYLINNYGIKTNSYLNLYPRDQTTIGLKVDVQGSEVELSAFGTDFITYNDNIKLDNDKGIRIYMDEGDILGVDEQAITLYGDTPEAKPYLAWNTYYDSNGDGSADTKTWSAWLGAHYNTSLNSDAHQHWSVETFDTDTGSVNTRFEIGYGKPVSELWVGINAVNYLNLKGGVDLRFTTGNVEKARIEVDDSTNHMSISTQGNGNVIFNTGGLGDVVVQTDELDLRDTNYIILNGADMYSDQKIDFFPNSQTARSMTFEDDGSRMKLKVYGSSELEIEENDVFITGVKSDGAGSVVCIKSNGAFGTCTDAPDASGDCTCV